MADYNAQRHFAHEHREDGRKSPDAVLGLYVKPRYQPADLRRIFYEECFERVLDDFGRVRIMHWLLLGNEVFARREVELWVSPDALTVEHGAETLSRYEVEYRAKPSASAGVAGELRQVRCLELFETAHLLPQPRLFGLEKALGDGWIKALKLDGYAPPQRYPESPSHRRPSSLTCWGSPGSADGREYQGWHYGELPRAAASGSTQAGTRRM